MAWVGTLDYDLLVRLTAEMDGYTHSVMLTACIACAIGFGLRGWTISTPQPPSPGPGSVAIATINPLADADVVETFLTEPSDCDFARALVALARKQ